MRPHSFAYNFSTKYNQPFNSHLNSQTMKLKRLCVCLRIYEARKMTSLLLLLSLYIFFACYLTAACIMKVKHLLGVKHLNELNNIKKLHLNRTSTSRTGWPITWQSKCAKSSIQSNLYSSTRFLQHPSTQCKLYVSPFHGGHPSKY